MLVIPCRDFKYCDIVKKYLDLFDTSDYQKDHELHKSVMELAFIGLFRISIIIKLMIIFERDLKMFIK